jgi:tRNA (cmo5U34)-methyltransferase
MPAGPWAFDDTVTAVFGDMLRRSIPQYDVMRKSMFDVGKHFVRSDTAIVDLGTSHGDALAPFVAQFGSRNKYIGVETSKPMLAAARERFAVEIAGGVVDIVDLDLRNDYPASVPTSLTLCVLSLQFIPIEHRQGLLDKAFESTVRGGAFLLVEKILGTSATLTALMTDLYHARKMEAGYTAEEVMRKRLSLEGVLVPVTAGWNEQLLRGAGFKDIDCFWRWMNFAGWIATK